MQFLIFLFLSTSLFANSFWLVETPQRFRLEISPVEIKYSTNRLSAKIPLGKCNVHLGTGLNSRLIHALDSSAKVGAKFKVDGQEFKVANKSELAIILAGLEAEIVSIREFSKKRCFLN